jgi:endoglucanase
MALRNRLSKLAAFVSSLLIVACAVTSAYAGVSVSGNGFIKDGAPWVPQGFSLVGLTAPRGHELNAGFARARTMYGPALFDQARSFGANTLRIQVSQPGLDPQSSIYDPAYLGEVVAAVRQARTQGFVVIVSMQWEAPSGLRNQYDMPGDSTQRAWARLAPAFTGDQNVMLELFNEPSMWETNPQAWPVWRRGMQALVDQIRAQGVANVLILDGIHGSHLLEGAPSIRDPLGKLAYAVHPYFQETSRGPGDWERQWGRFADSHPVVVSEWNALSNLNCSADIPDASARFIDFIKRRRIGLILWALDLPATITNAAGEPLGLRNFQCGAPGAGAARIAIQYMKSTH